MSEEPPSEDSVSDELVSERSRGEKVLLALETSAPVGSVALALGGDVLARRFLEDRRAHAAALVPAVDDILAEAGYDRDEIDGVVVGAGPGSFTGVRVAAATAKGLAHGLGIPLWTVSSLEAAAVPLPRVSGEPWEVPPELGAHRDLDVEGPRYVLFDARGRRVYAGCFRVGSERVEVVVEPEATTVDEVLAGPIPGGARFAGSGALRHRHRIAEAGHAVLPPPAGMPTADGLIRVLALEPDRPPLADPAGWEPDYLRASSAERAEAG